MTEKQIHVTDSDLQRLKTLLRDNWLNRREDAGDLNRLEYEMERARVVRSTEIPKDVVTMNSRVLYVGETADERRHVKIVYPR